ncbi:MAG: tripartite tricarboxylate transporter TctB family protein [Bacillota bacterium]
MRSDTGFGLVFAVLGLSIVVSTFTLPERLFDFVGPRVFPQVIGTLMFVFAAALIVKDIRSHRLLAGQPAYGSGEAGKSEAAAQAGERRPAVALLLLLLSSAFALALPRIGFFASSLGFLAVSMMVLRGPRPARLAHVATLAVLLAGAMYLSFEKLLGVMLP